MTTPASSRDHCSRRGDLAAPCSVCGAKEFNICQPLDPARQASLYARAVRLHWARREPVFAAGQPARHVYNLTEGMVALSRSLADGRRQIFGFLLPGDFIGLEAGDAYGCDAETLSDAKACRFDRATFDAFLRDNPDVALGLVRAASSELAQARQHELLLGRKTAVERVASFLLDLRNRAGERHLRTQPLSLPMTRSEIADYTGLTIETVSRVFGRLKSQGTIDLADAMSVRVLDEARLRRLSEGAD